MLRLRTLKMPDKPTWCGDLDEVIHRLKELPDPWVDTAVLQEVLGVGRRRAQQLLAPCVTRQIGANGVADREAVITHLQRLATGETTHYEQRRRLRLAEYMNALYRERQQSVFVEAPANIVSQDFKGLPQGVSITPGRIGITFDGTTQALQRLLALAMAIRNDELSFERLATGAK
jgi:hypothetical protein